MRYRALILLFLSMGAGRAQDPLKILPGNYRVVFENEEVRVIQVHYGPHEKLPVHDHPSRPTIYIYLSASGPVRFSHEEKHPFTVVRPALTAGEFRISPGRIEAHRVENLGDLASDFLRVELKTVPLGKHSLAFRSGKTFDLTKRGVNVEFDSSLLVVRRIVAPTGTGKQHYTGPAAGLLVTFAPVCDMTDGRKLKAGEVTWVPASFDLQPVSNGAHLLWITLK